MLTADKRNPQAVIKDFNSQHKIGTKVKFWPDGKEGKPVVTYTISSAQLWNGESPSVFLEKTAKAVPVSEIEILPLKYKEAEL